jgi:hypothetical protein
MSAPFLSVVANRVASVLAGGLAVATGRRRSPKAGPESEHRQLSPYTAFARRMRTGRLPLPQRVADLTPLDEPALAAVNAFADRLADLPASAWLAVGRSVMANNSFYELRATPFAILEATINDRGLAVAAWYVRDAIETSAFYATRPVVRWTSHERRAFAAAHGAAEESALAILAQPFLSSGVYATLCGPFSTTIAEATGASDR